MDNQKQSPILIFVILIFISTFLFPFLDEKNKQGTLDINWKLFMYLGLLGMIITLIFLFGKLGVNKIKQIRKRKRGKKKEDKDSS